MGSIFVTGSVSFDSIMTHDGLFADAFDDRTLSEFSVSFVVDPGDLRSGGNGANICYTLAQLRERPYLVAAVGRDFSPHAEVLAGMGVRMEHLLVDDERPTANCIITTDRKGNQIALFSAGAMEGSKSLSLAEKEIGKDDFVVIGPEDSRSIVRHVVEAFQRGATVIFEPGQQIHELTDAELQECLTCATMVVANDEIWGHIESRTAYSFETLDDDLIGIRTDAANPILVRHSHETVSIPTVKVDSIVDSTGTGDAFIAGLLAGLNKGLALEDSVRTGAVAASYVLGEIGPQSHMIGLDAFRDRFEEAYGKECSILFY